MATLSQKINAEVKARLLVDQTGLPQPDQVEYGHTCIRLLWHAPRAALVVEIDDPRSDAVDDPLEEYR